MLRASRKISANRHRRLALICLFWALFFAQKSQADALVALKVQSFCDAQIESAKETWDFFNSLRTGLPSRPQPGIAVTSSIQLIQKGQTTADETRPIDATIRLAPSFHLTKESGQFQVYSRGKRDRDKIDSFFADVELFAAHFKKLGFNPPKRITLIIDNKFVPFEGSLPMEYLKAQLNFPLGDLQQRDEFAFAIPSIDGNGFVVMPSFPSTAFAFDRSIAFHEIMHLLLSATIENNNLVHTLRFINEALVDFAAAHITNDAAIAKGLRIINRPPAVKVINFETRNPYTPSLLFSSVLWKVREKVGASGIDKIIFPFVMSLSKEMDSVPASSSFKDEVLSFRSRFLEVLFEVLDQSGFALSESERAEIGALK